MKSKIEIKAFNNKVLFSHTQENNTIRDTLEKAVSQDADLTYADLTYATLRNANLEDANLMYADLEGADLRNADLRNADLRNADLTYADLTGANLEGANLMFANLMYANLGGANLMFANLMYANLMYANLGGAKNIPESYINQCSRDMLFVFEHLKTELPFLREKLVKGQIDGTQYEGQCACLIGTLAKGDKKCIQKTVSCIPFYIKGLHNYCEQWFFQIRKGDTPQNSFFAAHALVLIDSVLEAEI